ncbi:hypothetical protein AALK14_16585 [Butyricimonas hominis]|uniref:hypothetical protein n=1 Tax=Butyricimonas TaxID=574697 RepID=UPI0035193485
MWRGDGKAVFSLDPARGTCVHLYPFFEREDNSKFSENDYFTCEITPYLPLRTLVLHVFLRENIPTLSKRRLE